MAEIRAGDWGTEEYWKERILQYLTRKLHPREALGPGVAFACLEGKKIVGLIAGHLTRRFDGSGEVEWISVRPECRGQGVGSGLLHRGPSRKASLCRRRTFEPGRPNLLFTARRSRLETTLDDLERHSLGTPWQPGR